MSPKWRPQWPHFLLRSIYSFIIDSPIFRTQIYQQFPSYVADKDLRSALALVIFDCSVTGELLPNFLVNFWDFSILKPKIHLNLQVSKIKFLESSEGGRLDFGS